MATVPPQAWARDAAASAPEATALAVRRAAFWVMVVSKLVAGWGLQWDIQWHIRIGRDSFWIAPHVMTYAGVTGVVLASFGVLAWETWRRRAGRPTGDEITVVGLAATPGFHLAAWGIALTVLAAPIDDLWHRLFGIDVTLWSPPHLLGILGSLVNTLACLLIAGEIYPRGPVRVVALVLNAAMTLSLLMTTAQPAFRMAYLYGGIAFHLWAILGALLLPLAYVTAARLTGLRAVPVLVLLVMLGLSTIGSQIARVGFEILQPVSVIEEEIAKDPTSPIAVATAIARKNGERPSSRTLAAMVWSLIAVVALVLVDPRGRPRAAGAAFGATLAITSGWTLASSPAFAPMVPSWATTGIALVLALLAGAAGAGAGAWLAQALSPWRPSTTTSDSC